VDPLSPSERTNAEKLLAVAWEFLACRRGTLWQVDEELWIEVFSDQGYASDRRWHPGLCLALQGQPAAVLPAAIMTLGTSGKHGPLVVCGVTKDLGAGHPTSFGELLAPISGREFVTRPEHEEAKPAKGRRFSRARVVVNWDKRFLSVAEAEHLDAAFPDWLWE
jgi:hypothetical protein